MLIREIKEDDLPEIFSWFETRKWPLPVIEGVGPKQGLLAEHEGKPVACLWIYMTGTSVADIDWIGTNPFAQYEIAKDGIKNLIESVKDWSRKSAPEAKVRALRFYTRVKDMAALFSEHEFQKRDGYTRMLWTLKP
jgi:hypothetical protein